MDEDVFKGRLLPGERLAWTGQLGRGLLLTRQDIFLIPFSLIWCGFAVFWTGLAMRSVMAAGRAEDSWFPLFGLAFIGVGLYFVAGRFVLDAWIRGQVRYALTDRRVLISRTGPFSAFSAVNLDRLPDVRLTERRDGRGTIRFGQPTVVWGGRGFSTWAPALDPTPQFLAIQDARRVFDLVQRASAPP